MLPKLYRFALKRLLGPFLVGNELSLDDFEVKLRAKEVYLRNLNLDVVALNGFLEMDDVEIVSATIASVQLSFRETLCLSIAGINLVVRPSTAAHRKSTTTTMQDEQQQEGVLKKDETPTTVSESMSFLEVWVDRITTTLQFELVDVNIRIESGGNGGGNVALCCTVQRATSLNEEQFRKTELFGVSLQVMVNDSEVIELASAPHLLLRTPRSSSSNEEEPETTQLAVELLVKRIAIQGTPRSLQLVQEFYYEALLQRLLSSEDEDDENALQLSSSPPSVSPSTKPPMRFMVHAEQVDFALVVDTEQLVCKALGFRMNNDALSLDRVDFQLDNSKDDDADLWFSIHRPNETEHDVTFTFGDSTLVLAFDLTMGTSMRFSTITKFANAFSPALAASSTSSAARAIQAIAPVSSSSTSAAMEPAFSLESMSSWRIVLEGELKDNVIIELHTIKGNASKLAIESGVIWMKRDNQDDGVEAPVFFLEKFLHISFVAMDDAPLTTVAATSSMSESPIEDEDEEKSMDIVQAAVALQTKAANSGQTIVDISLGGISTPLNLDVALYQRFLAVCLTPVSSSSTDDNYEDSEPASLPVIIRTTCKSGRLLLGEPEVAVEIAFEDVTTLTFGLDSIVQAEYFVVSEFLDCTVQVPICYASPYSSSPASSQQQALLAIVTQVSLLQSSVRAHLSNVIFRLEPASTGILRVAETFAPAAATATATAGKPIITTALELLLSNCVFDVFPSESPFDTVDSRHRPLSRMMLCCGEIQVHSNLVSQAAASSRFDVTSLDAQLYLAKHSTREVDEFRRPLARRLASNDEYAIQSGFVRIGQWQSTLLFLRFDFETTELEIEMQDGKVMTCPDSFQVLTDLFAYVTSTMETSKVEESVQESSSTAEEEESIDLQANSSLSASDLRKHLATAPDSALSAKQLKQRYEAPIHLTPFVIEDYYTFGSLPTLPHKPPQAEMSTSKMFPRRRKESDDNDPPPDDWVLFDEDDIDFKQHTTSNSNKRAQSSMPQRAIPPPPPPPPLPTCNSDGEDEDDDEEEDNDDDRDIMRNSIMFASVTKMSPTNPAAAAYTRKPQRETIQLIARDDIDRGAQRGIEGYKQLHESMLHIVHDIQERDQQTMASVHDDSEMYRSVMISNAEPSAARLWQPGQTLVHDDDDEEEEQADEESAFDGRYYEENMDGVKIINHHFPLPRLSQPGSFSPPPAALAARMIGETALPSVPVFYRTAQRGKMRFILRNGNMTWCLFGGTDFSESDEEEEEDVEASTANKPAVATAAVSLMVIEDHFTYSATAAATSTVLFPSSLHKPHRSKRDVNRAVECIVKGVSLVVDGFADKSLSLCFAVHDLDVRDEVKTSPFKQVLHYWDSTGEPRWMGADMLRISLDISSQLEYTIKAASLPIRIKLHQDMMDLFCEFAPRAENPDFPSKQSQAIMVFNSFDFRALKIKMDYFPKRIELAKLREGKYIELVRLFNYEGMEVALKRAHFTRVNGTNELASLLFNLWAEDVYNKQLLNLLAGVSPGLANIATDMANIVLLPVQILNKQGAAPAAHEVVRQGGKLAKTVFVEGIGMGNRVASGALNLLDESRTKRVPKSMEEGLVMAGQAMAARAKSAQHTIIAVPLATLRKEGATGAVKSVVRAIPIAVLQPVLGMGEAFEAITVGAQHSLKPAEYLQETTKWKH